MIGYFYEPQWFLSEVKLVQVNLPPYTAGCDADPEKVACDYPPYTWTRSPARSSPTPAGPAVNMVKNFSGPTRTRTRSPRTSPNKMSYDDAAKKWVDANAAKVDAWLAAA